MLGKLLTTIAGAREEILRECPTERIKFQSIGWAILITSGIAALSMWFALDSALGLNPVLALPLALLWGLAIMGIDRWLITSIPAHGSRRWAVAFPRLLLAILLGSIISTPIVLRIFQTEINNEIAQIDTQRANGYLTGQQGSQLTAKVNYWQGQVGNLQAVVNSHGQTPLNFSADPQIQSLNKQLTSWVTLEQKYYNQWQCQLYGIAPDGLRCKKGNGPLAKNSQQSYLQAQRQVSTINSEIADRKNALSSNSTSSAATRYQEAQDALPKAQAELQGYRTQQDNLRHQYDSTLPRNGLLIRLQALSQLTSGNATLELTRVLVFLLFLVIECLPVTVKLMQRPGNYEQALDKAAYYELKRAVVRIQASDGLPDPAAPGYAAGPDRAAANGDAHDLWQPTAPLPGPGVSAPPGTDFGSGMRRSQPDLDLRTLGVASPDDSVRARGGTPLHVDDDEG